MGWNRSQLVSLALRWQFWKTEALFLTAAFQCSGSFFESLCLELMVFWPRHRPIPGLGVSKEEVSQVKRQCFFVFLSSCHFPGVHLLLLELENLKSDTFWKHMQGCRDRKRERVVADIARHGTPTPLSIFFLSPGQGWLWTKTDLQKVVSSLWNFLRQVLARTWGPARATWGFHAGRWRRS